MPDVTQIGHLGPPIEFEDTCGTVSPSDPISLDEHDASEPFEIDLRDVEFLETLDDVCETAPLDVSFTSDGKAIVQTGSYVGVLTLPSGTQIEVTPKQSLTSLLWALHYAFDSPVDSMGFETEFTAASSFFDAIGVLFLAELRSVLDQGLHRDYIRTHAVREHVKGRINVQRQLQRSSPVPTDFAVEYDEFTTDTLLNRTVLAATQLLIRLVRDDELASRLRHHEQRLRESVSVKPVSLEAVERIELSRLNDHYETLLDLARTVLAREFFEDIRAGDHRSLALFINMNEIFERLVERSFQAAAREIGNLTVEGQASIPNIVEGPHAVSMRPDVLVTRNDGTPVTVVDAKWKSDSPSSGDVYQLTSYILALETPGALVYPERQENRTAESSVMSEHSLQSVELATNAPVTSYEEYVHSLETSALQYLNEVYDTAKNR